MNINNIAIVRATNIIPFEGILRPINESQYLRKNYNSDLAYELKKLLLELGIIPPFNVSILSEDYMKEYASLQNEIVKDYLPFTSDYNSLVLFSLNGLVPDDAENGYANNTFSDKNCFVIDALSEHINETISLVPTDTAIRGNVYLSDKAVIRIKEDTYSKLSIAEKQRLKDLNISVKTFTGDLKQAVNDELLALGYIPEELTLSKKWFLDSSTSDDMKALINNIAQEYNISLVYYLDILRGVYDYNEKIDAIKDELDMNNGDKVEDFYLRQFYQYLIDIANAPLDLSNYNRNILLNRFIEWIKTIGIDKYKELVQKYNAKLEKDKVSNNLLTPQEILNSYSDKVVR